MPAKFTPINQFKVTASSTGRGISPIKIQLQDALSTGTSTNKAAIDRIYGDDFLKKLTDSSAFVYAIYESENKGTFYYVRTGFNISTDGIVNVVFTNPQTGLSYNMQINPAKEDSNYFRIYDVSGLVSIIPLASKLAEGTYANPSTIFGDEIWELSNGSRTLPMIMYWEPSDSSPYLTYSRVAIKDDDDVIITSIFSDPEGGSPYSLALNIEEDTLEITRVSPVIGDGSITESKLSGTLKSIIDTSPSADSALLEALLDTSVDTPTDGTEVELTDKTREQFEAVFDFYKNHPLYAANQFEGFAPCYCTNCLEGNAEKVIQIYVGFGYATQMGEDNAEFYSRQGDVVWMQICQGMQVRLDLSSGKVYLTQSSLEDPAYVNGLYYISPSQKTFNEFRTKTEADISSLNSKIKTNYQFPTISFSAFPETVGSSTVLSNWKKEDFEQLMTTVTNDEGALIPYLEIATKQDENTVRVAFGYSITADASLTEDHIAVASIVTILGDLYLDRENVMIKRVSPDTTQLIKNSISAVASTTAVRTETGTLKAKDAVADDDLVTKKQLSVYVNEHTPNIYVFPPLIISDVGITENQSDWTRETLDLLMRMPDEVQAFNLSMDFVKSNKHYVAQCKSLYWGEAYDANAIFEYYDPTNGFKNLNVHIVYDGGVTTQATEIQ